MTSCVCLDRTVSHLCSYTGDTNTHGYLHKHDVDLFTCLHVTFLFIVALFLLQRLNSKMSVK